MSAVGQIIKRFADHLPHPLALKNPKGGANGMRNGDIVAFAMNGKPVRMDEALSDGDALCTMLNGEHAILKWGNLRPWNQK